MTDSLAVTVTDRTVEITDSVPALAGLHLAATIFTPVHPAAPIVFCCLPGGGLSRGYWDLQPAAGDYSYSFGRWMAERGYAVIAVDHAGTGDSSQFDDTNAPLLADVIAANDATFRILGEELRSQWSNRGLAVSRIARIGVGHSMGAGLTVRQQAVHETYDAICLLGFDTKGLPSALPPNIVEALTLTPPGDELIAEMTIRMFGSPYPILPVSVHGERRDSTSASLSEALNRAATSVLGAGGMLSLLPGNVARDARRIRVPVLILNGEYDSLINGVTDGPERYPAAAAFASHRIHGSGHNHNIAPTRDLFWEQVLRWAREHVEPARHS